VYGLSAYLLWGLFPLFWPLLEPADPLEILACRIVFCFIVIAVLLAVRHELDGVGRLDRGTLLRLCAAGILIAVNWGVYIWGVNNGHVIETSLGYFINPLVTIGLGVAILHERLRAVQWAAVGLGVVAVAVLSFDYGRPPWIALILASSFGTYGFLKKGVRASPPEGLFIEGAVTTVPALVVLAVLAFAGDATFVGHAANPVHLLLLASAGPGHRTAPALLCGRRHATPAVDDGVAPVRDSHHAVPHRGADPPRDDVVRPALRIRARLDCARDPQRRWSSPPPPSAESGHRLAPQPPNCPPAGPWRRNQVIKGEIRVE
jgi:chloramphenicol-sensitive protein RarD